MKIFKLILALVVLAVISFLVDKFWLSKKADDMSSVVKNNTMELCFAKIGTPNDMGFYDRYTLRMNLDNSKKTVSGELNFLPAEKDKKTGTFSGTVSDVNPSSMARTIDAIWNTSAEGMEAKESLSIIFGEGTASIGFGEMVDDGYGTYVYKDKNNINYSLDLVDISCIELNERESVGEYLTKNIGSLSAVQPVVGGSWYVLNYNIDISTKSGSVTYEDGHIQEKSNFSYTTDNEGNVVNLRLVGAGES